MFKIQSLFILTALFATIYAVPEKVKPARGNSACAQWCASNFPNPGKSCTSSAAKGTGPCYECGPAKTSASQQLCNLVCVNTASDVNNCGSCGNVCSTGQTCSGGACVSAGCTCPPSDSAGFALDQSFQNNGNLLCSYPVFVGENPFDFYCLYDNTDGHLVQDNDAGLCISPAQC